MTRVEELLIELHNEIAKGLHNTENVSVYIEVQQHVHKAHDPRLLARNLHKKIVGNDHDIDLVRYNDHKWYRTYFSDTIKINTFYE